MTPQPDGAAGDPAGPVRGPEAPAGARPAAGAAETSGADMAAGGSGATAGSAATALSEGPSGRAPAGPAGGGALLVVGDVVTDVVARHSGPPVSGTDTAAVIRTLPGGAGANVACWAAHWGCADVRLLGRVGAESVTWHERALTAGKVRPLLVVDPQASTGTVICLVNTDAAAERTFLTDSGASLRLSPADWSDSLLDGVGRLHLSGYLLFSESGRALVRTASGSARARGIPVSLDPASAGFLVELGLPRFLGLVADVDVLLPSRDEARLLTGAPDGADAAAELSRHVPLVVAKQGADGALVARRGTVIARVPAAPATPRDTTGAGDAFTGAFLAALLAGADAGAAAVEGCRAGARAVERVGGRPPAPRESTATTTDRTSRAG
ncbi:PfkB family carbohydrate kinase [Streptomyces sp. FL07-04A]|nr:PfkB family carbohydrate kinase [Streptomyces sp. FL07-04A]MDX3576307.1 PfkB family carbohydrate kinase [Streptomyces sp. FL07-04A]